MRYFLGLTVITSANFVTNASGQDVSLLMPAVTVVEYDPFNGFPGLKDLTLEINYIGDVERTASLVIEPDTLNNLQLSGSSDPLDFEINSPLGNSTPNRLEVPISLTPSSTPYQLPLTVKIPSGQYADAGDMDIDLKISLRDETTNASLSNEKIVSVVGRTPLRAQTNFAGTSSGFDNGSTYALVDFGEIIAGDSRNIGFQIRGNSDVDILMQSENHGRMVNLDAPETAYVEYSVNADGMQSDLSEPLEFTRRPARTLNGSNYPLNIILDPSQTQLFAGTYKDIITIEVTPR